MKRPQRNYVRHKKVVDQVFAEFQESLGRPCFTDVSRRSSVPESTVRNWYSQYLKDSTWRPYNTKLIHGTHNRIFTDEQEKAIADYIEANYFAPGYAFHNYDFQILAMQAFLELNRDAEIVREFNCSEGFMAAFKSRNNFVSRRAHYKRRPGLNMEARTSWIERVCALLQEYPADRVVNADETTWRILPAGATTWAVKGADSVAISVQDDEKKMITVMAACTAAGAKLPLFLIAKGKTTRSETTQIGDVGEHDSFHTTTGWMTEDAFLHYLGLLRERIFPDDQPFILIIDVYPTHRSDRVRQRAQELKIRLEFIPPGLTDALQPLDRRVFGALKGIAKHYIYRILSEDPNTKIGMAQAVQILVTSWEQLTSDAILSAWSLYLEHDVEESD